VSKGSDDCGVIARTWTWFAGMLTLIVAIGTAGTERWPGESGMWWGAAEIGAAVGLASWVVANNIPAFLGTKPAAPPGQWLELVVAALIAALVPALAFAGVAGLQNLLLWRVRIGIGRNAGCHNWRALPRRAAAARISNRR